MRKRRGIGRARFADEQVNRCHPAGSQHPPANLALTSRQTGRPRVRLLCAGHPSPRTLVATEDKDASLGSIPAAR